VRLSAAKSDSSGSVSHEFILDMILKLMKRDLLYIHPAVTVPGNIRRPLVNDTGEFRVGT
jgi:hypothetical protein